MIVVEINNLTELFKTQAYSEKGVTFNFVFTLLSLNQDKDKENLFHERRERYIQELRSLIRDKISSDYGSEGIDLLKKKIASVIMPTMRDRLLALYVKAIEEDSPIISLTGDIKYFSDYVSNAKDNEADNVRYLPCYEKMWSFEKYERDKYVNHLIGLLNEIYQ